jgi:hypothetical protein
MLRNRFRAWGDPLFHLLALIATLVAVAQALDFCVRDSAAKVTHPVNCHACSRCPSRAIAARDQFLLRAGAIDEIDGSN